MQKVRANEPEALEEQRQGGQSNKKGGQKIR